MKWWVSTTKDGTPCYHVEKDLPHDTPEEARELMDRLDKAFEGYRATTPKGVVRTGAEQMSTFRAEIEE